MGKNLCKWAGRLCGLCHIPLLAQSVLLRMANAAVDYEAKTETPKERRGICYMSREELAQQIYGDRRKVRYLDRPIADLNKSGLIKPIGLSARKRHVQEYRICVYEIVAIRNQEMNALYRNDAQEIGRIARNFTPR